MKNLTEYLIKFLIIFGNVILLNSTLSFADTIDQKRNEAINLFNDGNVKKSIKLLKSLANKEDDTSSMLALGQIYLKYKKVDQAFYWINASGSKCNKTALNKLKTFYLTKSSAYFSPYKYNKIVKNCDSEKSSKRVEKSLKKIISKNKTIKKVITKKYNLIDERVTNAWAKISQINGELKGRGSGFSILENGYFLTNHHVIENCNSFGIRYNKMYGKASLVNFNETLDIALLRVNAPTPYHIKFNSEEYIAGEEIFVAGFPLTSLTGSKMSINKGIVTNPELKKIGNTKGLIFISAPVASGNSGGPVINKYGELRGVVTGGMDKNYLKKKYEDKGAHIGNSTFSLMISGNLVKLWLDDINVDTHAVALNASQKEPEIIGKIAERFIAKIECYER